MPKFFSAKKHIEMAQTWSMSPGSFGIIRPGLTVGHWYRCREDFLESQGRNRSIAYCFRNGPLTASGRDIASFMRIVERKAKVSPKSEFGPTQLNKVIWIKLSPWWHTSSMKRSFLSMMLRSAQNYRSRKDNFESALFGRSNVNRYSRQTEFAVRRFLRGYTRYTGLKLGWHTQFGEGDYYRGRYCGKPDEVKVRQLLVKPL